MPILDVNNKKEISKFIKYTSENKHADFFQKYEYILANKGNNFEVIYVEKNENIIATMIIEIEKVVKQNIFYCHGAPCTDMYDIETVNELVKEVDILKAKYNPIALVFVLDKIWDQKLASIYMASGYEVVVNNKEAYYIDIKNKTCEDILDSVSEKIKSNIENAGRRNIKIKAGVTQKDFELFKNMFDENNSPNVKTALELEKYKKLSKVCDINTFRTYLAFQESKLIASAVICKCQDKVKCLKEVYEKSSIGQNARDKIHFEAIKWAIDSKCEIYDLGDASCSEVYDIKFIEGFVGKNIERRKFGYIAKVYNEFFWDMYKLIKKGKSE